MFNNLNEMKLIYQQYKKIIINSRFDNSLVKLSVLKYNVIKSIREKLQIRSYNY